MKPHRPVLSTLTATASAIDDLAVVKDFPCFSVSISRARWTIGTRLSPMRSLSRGWRKTDVDPVAGTDVAKAQTIAIKSWGEPRGERYARLKEIAQPTFVFHGVDDVMIPPINSYILAEHLPDARLVLYPDSGHCALFQYPHQFCTEVRPFLADAPH
jgi:pimeloyl-ACP methyl ester carboxylesterase